MLCLPLEISYFVKFRLEKIIYYEKNPNLLVNLCFSFHFNESGSGRIFFLVISDLVPDPVGSAFILVRGSGIRVMK